MSAQCAADELTALALVLERMAQRYSLIDVYGFVLCIAESRNSAAAVHALAALSFQNLPRLATRYARRLLAVVRAFLESSVEAERRAAAEALVRWAVKAQYASTLAREPFPEAVGAAVAATTSWEVAEKLLGVAKTCGIRVQSPAAVAVQTLVRDMSNGETAIRERILNLLGQVM
jgi:hypothetical protein